MTELEKITQRIDRYRNEMVDMQIKLCSVPAIAPINGGQGEAKKAELILDLLQDIDFESTQLIKAPDIDASYGYRPNIMATYKGKSSKKTIWILTHMDVVPPGEPALWKGNPFKGYVEAGKIYGRGVEDNQQDLIASIYALKAFQNRGIKPKYDVGLMFVSDEETGNEKGIEFILKKSNPFHKQDLIIVPGVGNKYGTMIEIAEKSIYWIKVKTVGKQTQGSTPEKGINSLEAASYLITELSKLYQRFPEKDSIFSPPISTFEPTKKEANVPNINTIPGEDIFFMDCRLIPKHSIERVKKEIKKTAQKIEKKFHVNIILEDVQKESTSPQTQPDAPVVLSLKKAVKDIYGEKAKPVGIGVRTAASFLRKAHYQAACWSKIEETAHQPDEYCVIDNMIGDAKVFAHVLLQDS
ncbi:MAG: M20 family metallo-hydrolase [Candidatus Aminicenantes bacterium]|nr:M20 family metallo-hydrolase [Candidatus Aminicenantes bacterium]